MNTYGSAMTRTEEPPQTMRRLDTGAARKLADLAAVLDDLQVALRCCERLLTELDSGDDVQVEALWTTAVLSYARCFGDGRLSAEDFASTDLEGEVQQWHQMLLQVRDHYADPDRNPRESCSVGATQDEQGDASGIAVTSTEQPRPDEVTVRQTGALAYALATLVEKRIAEQQQQVREAANGLSRSELDALPRIELTTPEG